MDAKTVLPSLGFISPNTDPSRLLPSLPPARTHQQITYTDGFDQHKVLTSVRRIYHPQLPPGGKDLWASVPLPIPSLPASHLQHCSLIEIDYTLMVRLTRVLS